MPTTAIELYDHVRGRDGACDKWGNPVAYLEGVVVAPGRHNRAPVGFTCVQFPDWEQVAHVRPADLVVVHAAPRRP